MICGAWAGWATAASILAGLAGFLPLVNGHCYLMEPVSRPFWFTEVFQGNQYPDLEFCPHCMQAKGPEYVKARAIANTPAHVLEEYNNGEWPHKASFDRGELHPNGNFFEPDAIAVRHGICGDPEQTKEEGSNRYSRSNSEFPVLGSYLKGSVIEMKVAMSVYHWGHLEFFICNAADLDDPDGVAIQSCFNKYPLTRADDDGSASPIDPTYPGRYYVDPPCRVYETDQTKPPGSEPGPIVIARYNLPEELTCERCIVQMIYYTSHVCTYPGYREFESDHWPSECAPTKEDWFDLGPELCGENGLYPEEFWNCADISITIDGLSPHDHSTSQSSEGTYTSDEEDESSDSSEGEIIIVDSFECESPADYYEECDECCIHGYQCMEMAGPGSYSECRPIENGCADDWDQCGGGGWTGPTCCWPGAECKSEDEWYAHCEPSSRAIEPRPSREDIGEPQSRSDCSEPVLPYEQCGGSGYSGSECCREGYACEEMEQGVYSECRPIEGGCSNNWRQCGGASWTGSTCCWPGSICVYQSVWFDQCIPVEEL